ncbi:type II secretion system protein GspK, partial [Pseudomonas sp.]|uniref:type II secretion system protein GspK n=1 Tax=Pseudomonas sp. TaxID=306 RepID=UPI0025906D4F
HTRASLAAEAGLNLAVRALVDTDPQQRWVADGRVQTLRFDDAVLQVSVRSERGKLDLNAGAAGDFARLVAALGAGQGPALAAALDQRRSDNQPPLRALEELRDLPGMSTALYQALVPEVTVWSGQESPDPALATPWLRRALGLPSLNISGAEPGPILTLTSVAQLPGGFSAALVVTLLLNPSTEGARPYRVLHWQE